ncbi:unnamed protein product [Rotaria socialis]|uniref:DUF7932 domain-containing protein n=1 Tax=Rotaria socialis TaxID=392032 RepID=A0A817RRK6_9BILA|nr:unnamed protein product [Rotaria socialis]CAF4174133.1 unnamed protein product [Rotaria socialis]
MSIVTEVELPIFPFDVYNVSTRSLVKPVDHVISISGKSGSDGCSGTSGSSGIPGTSGSPGIIGYRDATSGCGSTGGNGSNGFDGHSGQSGTDAQHALIWLKGTIENLNLQLATFHNSNNPSKDSTDIDWNFAQLHDDVNYDFRLAKSKGIILVKAVGGNGGDGGRGGNGGRGGDGGSGGHGYNGPCGSSTWMEGINGADGSDGGPGGNGGDGGNGGNGGSGGNGGNAGAGGHVQVRSRDSRLFMLIELDCRAGTKGEGGQGGSGGQFGSRGSGGAGGSGGSGGSGGPDGRSGMNGSNGRSGSCGSSGSSGISGSNGRNGRAAMDGSIQYAVIDIDGNIIETSSDKYHASVICYTITDQNNDGIYEPDSDFHITDVKWANNGAMTLPSGSLLSFPSTEYISTDIKDVSVLTGANINQVLLDSHRFKCHINATSALSINQPFIQSVKITSQINLLNRSFNGSEVSTMLTCQYPIQIENIEIPTHLAPNEQAVVTVKFANISTRSYGVCQDSAGPVEFIFSTHSLIKFLPMNEKYGYQIMPDGRTYYKINKEISPKSTELIKFKITLHDKSVNHYYKSLFWDIDLLLRDTQIEKRRNTTEVVPIFTPNIHTDVLLVTNSKFKRAEFLAYQNLFKLFNYSNQIWDIKRYGAFHHPEIKWLNTADLIIFIYSNPESTFRKIKSDLFLQHMKSSNKAGFICIGSGHPDELDFTLFDYDNLQFIDEKQQTKSEATNHRWSGIGFRRPHTMELNAKANKIRTNYEKQEDHRFLYQVVYDNTINEDSTHFMNVVYGNKYVYKSTLDSQIGNRVIMVTCDDPRLTKSHVPFILQDEVNTEQHDEIVLHSHDCKIVVDEVYNEAQSQRTVQTKIYLTSQFGRLLCAILFYRGFEKSHLIISEKCELANCIFTNYSNSYNFNQILVGLVMSIIEREYDRESVEFQSTDQLMNEIASVIKKESNTANKHSTDKNNWLYLLIQSLHEYIDSKFWSSFPWCGCTNKAKQLFKLQAILSDLHSYSTIEICKNKEMFEAVRILRLQKLTNLKFPVADKRDNCARPLVEIQQWKVEQKSNEIKSSITSDRF